MRKKYFKVFITLFLVISLMLLVSCSSKRNSAYDDEIITNGKIELQYINYGSYESYKSSNSITMSTFVISHNRKPYTFSVKKALVIRESNKAEYSTKFDEDIILECDIGKYFNFSVKLPTPLSEDKYYLEIKEKHSSYRFYLYENPNAQKHDIVITYIVDNEIVERRTTKNGRAHDVLTDYINADRTKYVSASEWTTNDNYDSIFYSNKVISDDITVKAYSHDLYGGHETTKNFIIDYVYYLFEGCVAVIPAKINDKPVALNFGDLRFCLDKMTELYLPLDFSIEDSLQLDLYDSLKSIYYEGTEEQFNEIISGKRFTKKPYVKIYYNSTYE